MKNVDLILQMTDDGCTPKTIADFMNKTTEEVRIILRDARKEARNNRLKNTTVRKIRDEYQIMLKNGYKRVDIRKELADWYGIDQKCIYRIVTLITYKNI